MNKCFLHLLPILALAVATPGYAAEQAQQSARAPAAEGPALELAVQAAQVAIAACATADGQTIAVSLVDSAGVLKVLLAADGTSQRGVTSSTAKALTALHYQKDTQQLFERVNNDEAFAAEIAANPSFNARPGGIVIRSGDRIIGALGVGGGRTDHECGLAGLEKIADRL